MAGFFDPAELDAENERRKQQGLPPLEIPSKPLFEATKSPTPLAPDPSPMERVDAQMPLGPSDMYRKNITSTSIPKAGKAELGFREAAQREREKEIGAIEEAGLGKQKQIEEKARGFDERATIGEEYAKRQQALALEHDATIKQAEDRWNRTVEEHRNAKPSDFWADKTTGDKVLAGIGIALSGLGSAVGATAGLNIENKALGIVQGAIDKHYQKELDRIGKMKDQIQLDRGRVLDLRDKKQEAMRQLDAWKAAAYEQAANRAEAALSRSGIPVEQAQTNGLVAGLRAKSAEENAAGLAQERERARTTVSKTVYDPRFAMARAQEQAATAPPGSQSAVYGPGGTPLFSTGDKQKDEKLNAANTTYRDLRSTLDELRKSYTEYGYENPYSDERTNRNAIIQRAITMMKEQQKLGAMSDKDTELLTKQIGDGSDTQKKALIKIEAATRMLDRAHANTLDANGIPGEKTLPMIRGEGPQAEKSGGVRKRLKDGRVGTLYPDGTFEEG